MSSTDSTPARVLIRSLGLIILGAMALVPPWRLTFSLNGQKHSRPAGYHLLWNPPSAEIQLEEGAAESGYKIDLLRLSVQLAAVLILMNGGLYLAKRSQATPPGP